MSNIWNMERLRSLAGVQLKESATKTQLSEGWDDNDGYGDDEDPDVAIASKDSRQSAFEKRSRKQRASDDAEATKQAANAKAKAIAAKPSEPKPAKEAEPEAKADEKAADAPKRRGRAPSDDSKSGQARNWLTGNPAAKRGDFIKHAGEHFGMTKHHANTYFYAHKAKKSGSVSEAFVLAHPMAKSLVLAENREMHTYQWIDPTSDLTPAIFFERAEAEKLAKYMAEWRSQAVVIETIDLTA